MRGRRGGRGWWTVDVVDDGEGVNVDMRDGRVQRKARRRRTRRMKRIRDYTGGTVGEGWWPKDGRNEEQKPTRQVVPRCYILFLSYVLRATCPVSPFVIVDRLASMVTGYPTAPHRQSPIAEGEMGGEMGGIRQRASGEGDKRRGTYESSRFCFKLQASRPALLCERR